MGKFKYCSSRTTIGRILWQIRACTKELKYHQMRARYYYNHQTTNSWLSKAHKEVYNIHEIENSIRNFKRYIKELNAKLSWAIEVHEEKYHTHAHADL